MKKLKWIILLAVVGLPRMGWSLDACEQDRPKVCGGIAPGKGEVHACMLANIEKVSPDCRNTIQSSENLVQKFMKECKGDAQRFCAMQMELYPNDVVSCIKQHMEQFSPECKRTYKQLKAYNYPVLQ